MTKRFSREYGAHLHVAQEARRDHANLDFADVPIRQPAERMGAKAICRVRAVTNPPAATEASSPPNKYRNVREGAYASKREAKRAAELRLLQHSGAISGLREQVEFVLIPRQLNADGSVAERACVYRSDFTYMENGLEVVEDCKGVRTPEYVIKRKLMRFTHGIVVRET